MNITEFVQESAEICQFSHNTLYEGFQADRTGVKMTGFIQLTLTPKFRYMSYGFIFLYLS